MRKVKLQMQLSLDGFVAGPNGEMDWMTMNWDRKLEEFVQNLTDPIGTILLGRKMAGGFVAHWTSVSQDPASPDIEAARKFVDTPKVVFSKTISASPWSNTTIANGDLAAEIEALKQKPGGDIMVYGGAQFVSSLIRQRLIDEYNLFINPVILGRGLSIFGNVETQQPLTLVHSQPFECGITVLCYQPQPENL